MSIKIYGREFWTALGDAFVRDEPEAWAIEIFEGAESGCRLREKEDSGVTFVVYGRPSWSLLNARQALQRGRDAGARAFDSGQACIFLVSSAAPDVGVFHAVLLAQGQVLRVVESSQGFVAETPAVSAQEIIESQPGGRTEADWNTLHQVFDGGLLVKNDMVFGKIAALFAALPAHQRTHLYEFGSGTHLRLLGQPDLPLQAIRFRYATLARELPGATAAEALAALAQDWAFG